MSTKKIVLLVTGMAVALFNNVSYADVAVPDNEAVSKLPIILYSLGVVFLTALAVVLVIVVKSKKSRANSLDNNAGNSESSKE